MIRETPDGWTAGPDDPRAGLLSYSKRTGKARAIPGVGLILESLTKGERPESVASKAHGDFTPWVYALAAIHYQRSEIDLRRLAASRCRRAYVINYAIPNGPLEDQIKLWGNPGEFESFVGARLGRALSTYGASELACIANLASRIERADPDRENDNVEKDFLKAIIKAAQEECAPPTKKAVKEIWMAESKSSEGHFKSLLKRTGFTWLPSGIRGAGR